VILVDIMIGYTRVYVIIFVSGSLFLSILLVKHGTFSVSDFCKLFYYSEKCKTSGVRSQLVSAIHDYNCIWLMVL
jgi:hypothetical protein